MRKIIKEISIGRQSIKDKPEKSDLLVHVKPSDKMNIEIKSSVLRLFKTTLYKLVEDTLKEYQVGPCTIIINDDGALDFAIKARIRTAVNLASEQDIFKENIKEGEILKEETKYIKSLKNRLRRSRLYLPGNNPYLMQNSYLFGADSLIFDLEDSVAISEKMSARFLVNEALKFLPIENTEKMVRINPLTIFGREDLKVIMKNPSFDTILLPKCESADDVRRADETITFYEKLYNYTNLSIALIPLIETAKGIINANDIAYASLRNVALSFGAEDFTADIGTSRTSEALELLAARQAIILASKANCIQALDSVFSNISDMHGLKDDTIKSKSLGFDGRGLIHPEQIHVVHEVYKPKKDEIEYAKNVIKAIDAAKQKGDGVVSIGRKMIDAPVEKRARNILKLAKKMGL